jgi:plasmid maintenance system antidote protein VapI
VTTTTESEMERFKEFADSYSYRAEAAQALGIAESTLLSILSGRRRLNDETRAAWKALGGTPDTPTIVTTWLELEHAAN